MGHDHLNHSFELQTKFHNILGIPLSQKVFNNAHTIFNSRCMREGYGSRSVCPSVTKLYSCYVPHLWVESKVSLGFPW